MIGTAAFAATFLTSVSPLQSFADNASGCDFAATGTTQSCAGPLAGSTFAGGDGNLMASPATYGSTDWQNVSGLNVGIDQPSGTTDNSFGQGTKEDNPAVTVVSGSIPPNKSDLTRFYEASEFANGSNYLYLAWERSNALGSANMDFEINQASTPALGAPGTHTINRTAGDLLVTFDFTNGGGTPTLGLLRWVTTGSVAQCFSANSLPCWGNHVTLNGTDSIGAVNNLDPVNDPIDPTKGNYQNPVPALQFGEAAINLTTAGAFTGSCQAFGSTFLKSRSSASFTAEVKDFVAPVPVNITNCGTIKVSKVTDNAPAGDTTSFGYSATGALSPSSFSLTNGTTQVYSGVSPGSYGVTEGAEPSPAWTLKSLVCTDSGGASHSINLATASITMVAGGEVDCTYTNHFTNSPSIATQLSQSTINIGDSASDSATLTGASANAGGTVTYTVYSDAACSTQVADGGTVTVTNGKVPGSNPVTFNNAGTFYWQAVYSGDANNNGATSTCQSEQLVVKTNPTIATQLSATTVAIGTAVSDSASLTGATGDASGTVTYTVYSDAACSTQVADGGTVTVTNDSVPGSNPVTFNNAGTFYWQAVYSGDAKNNGATSTCQSEQLVVSPNTPGISTGQTLLPNDNATITGATASAGGTITFSLYDPSDATCSNAPAYTQQVAVSGNGTYSTTNATFLAGTPGTWRWQVVYSGDNNNVGTTSACGVENFTITNG